MLVITSRGAWVGSETRSAHRQATTRSGRTSRRAEPDPLAASEQAWLRWVTKADFGRSRRWVARELEWDAYLLRSASIYEEVCGAHTITQDGYYQYSTALNLGTRSWPYYLHRCSAKLEKETKKAA